MKTMTALAFLLMAICCAASASAVTIDMVTVGNAGNAPDTRYMWYGKGVAKSTGAIYGDWVV